MTEAESPQPARHRRKPHYFDVEVRRFERVTPRSVRVTLYGEDLAEFALHGVAEHIKVAFPAPGQERPVMPTWTDEGPVYLPGVPRPILRTYTPRRFRPDVLELDVEFMLHEDATGVASGWAARVAVGDQVVVTSPGGPYRFDPDAREFVLAGDESALPAIAQVIESLPADARAKVFLEVEDAAEEQALSSEAAVTVQWIHRDGNAQSGELLERELRALEIADGTKVFVACEAGIMRNIRRYLLQERGLAREAIHTHGYWKRGVENHPDHDLGDD